MTDKLKGKVAVVTGGGDGIGKGIVLLMAEEGASVVVNDLNKANADGVVDEITKAGGKAAAVVENVASMEACSKTKPSCRTLPCCSNNPFSILT